MSASLKRTRSPRLLAALSLALALAGCSTYHAADSGNFDSDRLTAGGTGPGIPFQVDGSVGGVRGAPLATAVAAAMPAKIDGKTVHYTACEPYTECAGDHLVWTFGPPAARPEMTHPPAIGTNLAIIGGYDPGPNNVTVKVALFQGGNPVASISGQTDAAGPGDPAFQSLIADMAAEVTSGPDVFDWLGLP
jgi:hypothetical protein